MVRGGGLPRGRGGLQTFLFFPREAQERGREGAETERAGMGAGGLNTGPSGPRSC